MVTESGNIVQSYLLEGSQPSISSAHIATVHIPNTVDRARSNELNPQGIILCHELWPQACGCGRVYYIARSIVPQMGIVGFIEGQDKGRLGIVWSCCDGGIRIADSICPKHHRLVAC